MKVLILNPPNVTGYVKEGRCEQKPYGDLMVEKETKRLTETVKGSG